MFLSISNVATSDRVFAPDNLLFADQQSQGTSLRSLCLSILVCINPQPYDRFPFVFLVFRVNFPGRNSMDDEAFFGFLANSCAVTSPVSLSCRVLAPCRRRSTVGVFSIHVKLISSAAGRSSPRVYRHLEDVVA